MSTRPILNAFWGGWIPPAQQPPTLDATPAYVDVVTLAFTGPGANSSYETSYLCSYHSANTIIGWAKKLQARGQKVLLSVYDNPQHHWANVDIPRFVAHAVPVIRDIWGADGIDIDSESGNATPQDLIDLVREFRKALGANALITYDTFADSAFDRTVIRAVRDDVDWFNLMAYFVDTSTMKQTFDQYATLVPPEKITIGVKPGGKNPLDQSTPLPEVKQLAAWNPAGARKRGMMLYHLARDIPHYTNHPRFTWVKAIHEHLCSNPSDGRTD